MGCIEANVGPGWKILHYGAVLEDRKIPEVPVISVDTDSMSLSEWKSKALQLLAAGDPADFETSVLGAPEKVEVLAWL